MSGFNLFACHKYLEQSGAAILFNLAMSSTNDQNSINKISLLISKFSEMLRGHSNWEEHFVFKYLPEALIQIELAHHKTIEEEINSIEKELKMAQASIKFNLYSIYLRSRIFYSNLLSHFHNEETNIITMLRERLSEVELRRIDYDIYKEMSSNDILEMVSLLFPPCNLDEKLAVLEYLSAANPTALNEVRHLIAI